MDPEPLPSPKMKWWQDRAIVVGIIGVVATVVVGVLTYWLTAGTVSREYQERTKAARNDVLTAVARSIGEGVVPNKEKIQSVISSVERQYGIKAQDSEKPETVIDDIVARVLANEFLDAKRREELSSKLLAVKNEMTSVPIDTQLKQPSESGKAIPREIAMLTAFLTALISVSLGLRVLSPETVYAKALFRTVIPMLMVTALLVGFIAFLSFSSGGKEFLKWLQNR